LQAGHRPIGPHPRGSCRARSAGGAAVNVHEASQSVTSGTRAIHAAPNGQGWLSPSPGPDSRPLNCEAGMSELLLPPRRCGCSLSRHADQEAGVS
jgi:hypothetical protein